MRLETTTIYHGPENIVMYPLISSSPTAEPLGCDVTAGDSLLPEADFDNIVSSDIDLFAVIDAGPSSAILIICEVERENWAAILQEYIDNDPNPTGCVFLLNQTRSSVVRGKTLTDTAFEWKPEYRHKLPGTVLKSYFRSQVNTLICIGMLELTNAINMAGWLRGWKCMLQPGGSLVVELSWDWQDRTWRDAAKRYAVMASPLGFRLQTVNGCDVFMGGLLQDRASQDERYRIASTYRRQASRLVARGRHARLGHTFEDKAKNLTRKGVLDENDFIKDGDKLYGRFVQCGPHAWSDF
ncbi:hypothetical protein COCC4DRAFT_149295 [Bipolaris maydis ATCC 48331]|uniref:Uncharacterized protein n=2 Tax=Cochliobolus heterostrophus TaxID=5016 RepID=M2U9J6_COCH5|nr:uncharacterized protein COCC4DRAFT_149295 [Bipolaris maydis ATCC 48331]EMD95254.1 hypothetical protein COCHEDRAFT_1211216 [Bipolaris maydis C5]KAH7551162.1 hypothetical protein BM1_10036 [Bipolaris maydis]ENI00857.1 hypothetical protein COCC4DRAFT_149295 [Bipolaris maydis ATCC 48331]KAJ5021871.1 hypothetical protein J3E73DRAFT_394383 [Bipolaris maydis]KAJ5055045.1 hypothetical protein J3E74DRAFT_411496 [Bipolaris maydis]